MTPSACFVGGLCAISLKEALPALGLQIDYFPDRYEVTGADVFTYPRREDSTPYDALRHRGHLEPESFTRKVRAWRKSKKQSELAECV
jgi:hypothetical protein